MYNRWFSEPQSDGIKIHIEIYVEKISDAVMLINRAAKQITEESKQWQDKLAEHFNDST